MCFAIFELDTFGRQQCLAQLIDYPLSESAVRVALLAGQKIVLLVYRDYGDLFTLFEHLLVNESCELLSK